MVRRLVHIWTIGPRGYSTFGILGVNTSYDLDAYSRIFLYVPFMKIHLQSTFSAKKFSVINFFDQKGTIIDRKNISPAWEYGDTIRIWHHILKLILKWLVQIFFVTDWSSVNIDKQKCFRIIFLWSLFTNIIR